MVQMLRDQMPAAFNGSNACGVQKVQMLRVPKFKCLRRSRVQVPAAFKSSKCEWVEHLNLFEPLNF